MKTVCIVGLGFVGSAMATAVASARDINNNPVYNVIGVDLPNKEGLSRVNKINKGEFPFHTSDSSLVSSLFNSVKQKNLTATTDNSVYASADIVVVDIHLDISFLDDNPDLKFEGFIESIEIIAAHIMPGTLVLIETTVPPGTCEKIVVPTLKKGLECRNVDPNSVHVAHSYERVMPGNEYLSSITDYWRVFSGYTDQAGYLCKEFLSKIINTEDYPLTQLSSTLASESAKVLENTYRAVNIAFIDEWTKYAEFVDIDLFEIIDAIGKRPTHSNIRFPGLGVGGYCLTKDPTFAPAAAKQLFGKELNFPFSQMAVNVNSNMPIHTVDRLKYLLNQPIVEKKILVCGVSYRQDVGDTRYSPTEVLVRSLISYGAKTTCHDPYLNYWDELNIKMSSDLPVAKNFDAVIVAVRHKQYRELDLSVWGLDCPLILDANGVFNYDQRKVARDNGVKIESIGRGVGL